MSYLRLLYWCVQKNADIQTEISSIVFFSLSDCKNQHKTNTHWGYSLSGFKILNIYLWCLQSSSPNARRPCLGFNRKRASVIPHFRQQWKFFLVFFSPLQHISTSLFQHVKRHHCTCKNCHLRTKLTLFSLPCSNYGWEYAGNNLQRITLSASRCNRMHQWFGLSFSVFFSSSSSSPPDVCWGDDVFCTWRWILLLALGQTFSFCLWCEPFPTGVDGLCYRRFQCFWWSV